MANQLKTAVSSGDEDGGFTFTLIDLSRLIWLSVCLDSLHQVFFFFSVW